MLSADNVRHFADIIQQGGVIAYPTETVFGLGCDPKQPQAITRLLNLKNRPANKGLILLAATAEQLQPYSDLSLTQLKQILNTHTDHPTTWLVPKSSAATPLITGDFNTVAIRITQHPHIIQLCNKLNAAITSTSANLSQHPTAQSSQQIADTFNQQLDGIIPGKSGGQSASQIIDWKTNRVIRSIQT